MKRRTSRTGSTRLNLIRTMWQEPQSSWQPISIRIRTDCESYLDATECNSQDVISDKVCCWCSRVCVGHVVERRVFNDVERGGAVPAQVAAELARGHGRGQLELQRGLHGPARLPRPILAAAGRASRGHRWQASTPLQAAAKVAQGHREPAHTPIQARRQSRPRNRHPRRISG